MEWSLTGTQSEDEKTVTVRLSNRTALGTFNAATWRADAAREMVEQIGAARAGTIAVYLGGKTRRISIAKHLGDE